MRRKKLPCTFVAWVNAIERRSNTRRANRLLGMGYGGAAEQGATTNRAPPRKNIWS